MRCCRWSLVDTADDPGAEEADRGAGQTHRCSSDGEDRHLLLVLSLAGAERQTAAARRGFSARARAPRGWRTRGHTRRCWSGQTERKGGGGSNLAHRGGQHERILVDLLLAPAAPAEFRVEGVVMVEVRQAMTPARTRMESSIKNLEFLMEGHVGEELNQ